MSLLIPIFVGGGEGAVVYWISGGGSEKERVSRF